MLDDLAGKRTGERIRILRERRGLTRPTLAGLVGRSASWLKGIETGRRLPPGYHHPWTQFGTSNVAVHAVSVRADLSKSAAARDHARQIDPDTVPSRECRARTFAHLLGLPA